MNKAVAIPEVNEISASSCGRGIKKLASTADADQVTTTTQKTPEPLLHVDSSDDDHSSDLATSELWSCKKVYALYNLEGSRCGPSH